MTEKLMPCPFCGSKAVTDYDNGPYATGPELSYGIICLRCGARTELRDTKDEAIAAWNRRADDDN